MAGEHRAVGQTVAIPDVNAFETDRQQRSKRHIAHEFQQGGSFKDSAEKLFDNVVHRT